MNNEKKYIGILLISTFISVGIMINNKNYWSYSDYQDMDKQNSLEDTSESKLKNNEVNLEEEKVEKITDDISEDYILVKNEEIESNNKDDLIYNEEKNNYIENYDYNDNYIGLQDEETVNVFKVNKNNIINEIPNNNKLKLVKMANKLSVSDYKQLINHIKRSDELPAAIDILSLLKEKLSHDDYKELTDMLKPYINIEMIENKINKK